MERSSNRRVGSSRNVTRGVRASITQRRCYARGLGDAGDWPDPGDWLGAGGLAGEGALVDPGG